MYWQYRIAPAVIDKKATSILNYHFTLKLYSKKVSNKDFTATTVRKLELITI